MERSRPGARRPERAAEAGGGSSVAADPRSRLERDIGNLFDQLFAPVHPVRAMLRRSAWHPFTDVFEDETRFVIRMELAGIDPRSLAIRQEGRCLIVSGNRPDPHRGRSQTCHQLEVSYGLFERVICLPVDFREDAIRPEYQRSSGFLEITVEKE